MRHDCITMYWSAKGQAHRLAGKRVNLCYMMPQVRDFRNDVILAEACRADVETYCKNTPAGMPLLLKEWHGQ